jgi:hypothetical protein
MLTKEEILAGLTAIANQYSNIAIAWHVIILIIIAALFAGWKPVNSLMILLLGSLLMSVSVFASMQANFFNATVFALLVIMSIYVTLRSGNGNITGDRSWVDISGLILIIFGLIYPEFLKSGSSIEYTYASPTGLIPCPTLSVLTGFALLYKGFRSQTWSMTIGISGMFYGLFGVIYLGMHIDWVLVVGAGLLLMNTLFLSRNAFLPGNVQ